MTKVAVSTIILFVALTVVFAQLPPVKQAIEDRYTQERAAGVQDPAPRNPNASYPIVSPRPFDLGLFNDCDSFHSAIVVNCWHGVVNGVETVVSAGVEPDFLDAQQGVVVVFNDFIYTPVRAGSVHITAVQSPLLMLVSATQSYVFTFNISTRTFTAVAVIQPSIVPPTQAMTTTSGLAYSRITQTFNGTVTVKNIGSSAIIAPIHLVLSSLTAGVTVVNGTGVFNGSSFVTFPMVSSLAPGQSSTATVQLSNPSNGPINFTPVIYSGAL